MATREALQKKRAGLAKQSQAHRATVARHLAALVEFTVRANEIDGRIAMIDLQLNGITDAILQRMVDTNGTGEIPVYRDQT